MVLLARQWMTQSFLCGGVRVLPSVRTTPDCMASIRVACPHLSRKWRVMMSRVQILPCSCTCSDTCWHFWARGLQPAAKRCCDIISHVPCHAGETCAVFQPAKLLSSWCPWECALQRTISHEVVFGSCLMRCRHDHWAARDWYEKALIIDETSRLMPEKSEDKA